MSFLVEQRGLFKAFDFAGEIPYQQLLVRLSRELWPDFILAPWEPLIRSKYGSFCKPDCILWRKGSDEWYVVEVELSKHSTRHVSDQLTNLYEGVYDLSIAPSIAIALEQPIEVAQTLIATGPDFLVIFDAHRDDVFRSARITGFSGAVLTPYLSTSGEAALHLNHLPSQLRAGKPTNRFAVAARKGIGNSVTLSIPSHIRCPDGQILLVMPDGRQVGCTSHLNQLRGPDFTLNEAQSYFCSIISTSPYILKIIEAT